MRKVTTEVQVLEDWFDQDGNNHNPDQASIKIKDNFVWKQERFVLEVNGAKFCISKRDMLAAIANATNFSTGE